MIHTKIHFVNPGYPRSSVTLQWRIVALNTIHLIILLSKKELSLEPKSGMKTVILKHHQYQVDYLILWQWRVYLLILKNIWLHWLVYWLVSKSADTISHHIFKGRVIMIFSSKIDIKGLLAIRCHRDPVLSYKTPSYQSHSYSPHPTSLYINNTPIKPVLINRIPLPYQM